MLQNIIRGSATNFPSAINIYVSGDNSGATYSGYAWVPSDGSDPIKGHVALLWATVDTGEPGREGGRVTHTYARPWC